MGNNLKSIRESKGMTLHEAAVAVGVSYGQYVKLERGERRLTSDYIMQASRGFGVPPEDILVDETDRPRRTSRNASDHLPFAGETQAGVWRDVEIYSNGTDQAVAIRPDPRYPNAKQYVWQVLGDSMDKAGILDGMYAVGVDYVDFVEHYRPVASGDIVVVERLRFGGQERERTIKRYWQEDAGIALMPESSNPHHKPLFIPSDGEVEGEEFKILAYVTGAYNLFGKAIYDLDEGQKIQL
jgi:SOS-response transcriptional repressor LexA